MCVLGILVNWKLFACLLVSIFCFYSATPDPYYCLALAKSKKKKEWFSIGFFQVKLIRSSSLRKQ